PPRAALAVAALLVAVNLPHSEPKGYLTFDDEYYAPDSIAQKGINTTTREEYEPRWVDTRPPHWTARLVGLDGAVAVQSLSVRTHRQEYRVRSEAGALVEASTFYYPDWTLQIDGREEPVAAARGTGTIQFRVPPGEHSVALALRPTRVRRLSALLSIATLIVISLTPAFRSKLRTSNGKSLET